MCSGRAPAHWDELELGGEGAARGCPDNPPWNKLGIWGYPDSLRF